MSPMTGYPQSNMPHANLVEEFHNLMEALDGVLAAAGEEGGEKLSELTSEAKRKIEKAKEKIASIEEDALKSARVITSESKAYVHEHPWTAIGIAAGVGLLLGILIERK